MKYSKGLSFLSKGDGTCYVCGLGSCTDLDVIIPPKSPEGDSVTSIGCGAFAGFSSLTSITIPDGVTSVGSCAFHGCPSLASVTIPDSVKSIESFAFWGCKSLTSVTFGENSQLTSVGNYAFYDCTSLTSIEIPSGVTSIGYNAFAGFSKLKSKSSNYKAFNLSKNGSIYCSPANKKKYYQEGKKSSVRGELEMCENGIHYCTNLFKIFNFYTGEIDKDTAIYECDVSDENIGEAGSSSKRCARWIIPRKRLYAKDVMRILSGGD